MLRHLCALAVSMLVAAAAADEARAQQATPSPGAPELRYAEQGWSDVDRDTFYTTSQGSRMMPYAWFRALRRLDVDAPFGADQLQRYGYLRNDRPNNINGLPVGFVIDGDPASGQLGMSCAACHTGQLEYQKDGVTQALRLDGAPANADFQQFLNDLTTASRETLAKSDRFGVFAKAVLGTGYTPARAAQLKVAFEIWVKQVAEFMAASLPPSPWGPGRLDAFGMIFNRVAAHDLGVPGNFKVADAPVSYPFLWNASRQDHTQWNGAVPNGLYIQGLARNTGEVFGVFAAFKPRVAVRKIWPFPAVIDYRANSADFAGLQTLEEKIATLQPPKWPFGLNKTQVDEGKPLFEKNCGGCHAERPSPDLIGAWRTPVRAVGTDPKMADNAGRKSNPGLYIGALLPPPAIGAKFADPAKTTDILAGSVVGSLLDEAFLPLPITPAKLAKSGVWRALRKDLSDLLPGETLEELLNPKLGHVAELEALVKARLSNLYSKPRSADAGAAYESRVLYGIWATAPYLHNGSVPNLWELLTPAKQRRASFTVGSRMFDPKNVGYLSEGEGTVFVTDPENANGNGNGGHEYGTDLSPEDRWAIIEYMKTL